jgi:hypothetical protein
MGGRQRNRENLEVNNKNKSLSFIQTKYIFFNTCTVFSILL